MRGFGVQAPPQRPRGERRGVQGLVYGAFGRGGDDAAGPHHVRGRGQAGDGEDGEENSQYRAGHITSRNRWAGFTDRSALGSHRSQTSVTRLLSALDS